VVNRKIPVALRRLVLVEAGHRCAIPTCRQHPVEVDHIEDWARVKEHRFENLIALCPTCHTRKGEKPGQIDRASLKIYKANLGILNSRYGELERRVLEVFAWRRQQGLEDTLIQLSGTDRISMMYLVQDGYVEIMAPGKAYITIRDGQWSAYATDVEVGGAPIFEHYRLTEAGKKFLETWLEARPIDPIADEGDGDGDGESV
jgi:hypothetical protein